MKHLAILFSLAVFLSSTSVAQSPRISTEDEIKRDLALVQCKSSERLRSVRDLFKSHGAADADMEVVEKDGTKNVVVTKKGSGTGTIVVGAHYDKTANGCGVIDNWTGIVAIAHLYATLKGVNTTKTFKFVAFDEEEIGLVGSEAFVKMIPKTERESFCSMVNLDSFGFAAPYVMQNASSTKLSEDAKLLFEQMKLKLEIITLAGAGADSMSFTSAGIPAITFSGLDNRWQQFLHSSNDQLKNINVSSVFMAYRTVLPFLARLDERPCDAYRKK
jgi:Zn-dependent M28 family amino/carboxypeptidase